jgi:hypothetical protein
LIFINSASMGVKNRKKYSELRQLLQFFEQ